jgi:POT family proton-dependent oligopeptide transporter
LATSFVIIWGIVLWKVGREFAAVGTEVPATWSGILNSLFIVCFAPVFQNGGKVDNLSGPMKFGLGMTLLGLGFDSSLRKYGY